MRRSSVVLVPKDDTFLMLHRKGDDFWGLPGGGQEQGEELEDTARRELMEEVGLVVQDLLPVFTGTWQSPTTEWEVTFFWAFTWTGTPEIKEDTHDQMIWGTVEEILKLNIFPLLRQVLITNVRPTSPQATSPILR